MYLSWITNAGHTSISCMVESHRIQILLQTTLLQISWNSLRPRGEWSFNERFDLDPSLVRIAAEQSCSQHHSRIWCVCAWSNGGDHDWPVVYFALCSIEIEFGCIAQIIGIEPESFETYSIGQRWVPIVFQIFQSYVIMRSLWARNARLYCRKIQL